MWGPAEQQNRDARQVAFTTAAVLPVAVAEPSHHRLGAGPVGHHDSNSRLPLPTFLPNCPYGSHFAQMGLILRRIPTPTPVLYSSVTHPIPGYGKMNYSLGNPDPNWPNCLKSGQKISLSGKKYTYIHTYINIYSLHILEQAYVGPTTRARSYAGRMTCLSSRYCNSVLSTQTTAAAPAVEGPGLEAGSIVLAITTQKQRDEAAAAACWSSAGLIAQPAG